MRAVCYKEAELTSAVTIQFCRRARVCVVVAADRLFSFHFTAVLPPLVNVVNVICKVNIISLFLTSAGMFEVDSKSGDPSLLLVYSPRGR